MNRVTFQHNKTQCVVIPLLNCHQAAPFPIAHFHPHKLSLKNFYQCLTNATQYLLSEEYTLDHKTVYLSYQIQRKVLCCLIVFYSMHLRDTLRKQLAGRYGLPSSLCVFITNRHKFLHTNFTL